MRVHRLALVRARQLHTRTATAALASRRHLEYAGKPGESLVERAREAQEARAKQAAQHATDYMMPKTAVAAREEHAKSQLRATRGGRDALVETNIQAAMSSGILDNLPGKGQPLARREENAFEELSGMSVAHRVLKNAGCAPAWVESRKRIAEGMRAARVELFEAWCE